MTHMAALIAFYLLLVFPLSSSQTTLRSEQKTSTHRAPATASPPLPPPPPPPPPAPVIQNLLGKEDAIHLNAKQSYARLSKDNAKVGVFIAASIGTFMLMVAVYCIYNKFYTKQQYLHTQLDDDADLTADPMEPPPVFFHSNIVCSRVDVRRDGYGSLSDTPSIISMPPSLAPPPSTIPFPPFFQSSRSLKTISAKDLEKSCL